MASANTLLDSRPYRVAITIPDNTGNGTILSSLLTSGGYAGPTLGYVRILGKQPNSATDHLAFVAASPRPSTAIAATDFTTHGRYVSAGEIFDTPTTADMSTTYLRSFTAASITVLCEVIA